ncbi:MAG: hypothetical protein A4E42_01572 [Methanoregulaceae archaeon PtaU1.Bin222]|nr:MAG: hypothetical protein A4E42_01572 [Methanoregulaceae archaeon PtaU1.Bin222]
MAHAIGHRSIRHLACHDRRRALPGLPRDSNKSRGMAKAEYFSTLIIDVYT